MLTIKCGQVIVYGLGLLEESFTGSFGELNDDQRDAITAYIMQSSKRPVKAVKFVDVRGHSSTIGNSPPPTQLPEPLDVLEEYTLRTSPYDYGPEVVRLIHESVCPECLTGTLPVNVDTGEWVKGWETVGDPEPAFKTYSCRYAHVFTVYRTAGGDYAVDDRAVLAFEKLIDRATASVPV